MRIFLALGLIVISGPVLALSCIRPDVATTFQRAAEAREIYLVVHGRLTFDETRLPANDLANQNRPDTFIPARLEGKSLSVDGFETPFLRDISLGLQCFGPWCGGADSGAEYLAFLRRTETGYVMLVDPCGSFAFPEPTSAQLDQAVSCMRGEGCAQLQ